MIANFCLFKLEKYHDNVENYLLKEYSFGNLDLNKYVYFLVNIYELNNFAISDEFNKNVMLKKKSLINIIHNFFFFKKYIHIV